MDSKNLMSKSANENYKVFEDTVEPEQFEYYNHLKNREIYIESDISEDFFSLDVVHKILFWNREDVGIPSDKRKPIIIYFFSCGGDLDICNATIDIIASSTTPIIGVNLGRCLSAAAYIFISCHKRYMLPKSYFLFHQGSSVMSGDFLKIESQIDDYKKQVSELSSIMKKYTDYSDEEIAENITKEWYVRRDEAIEKGVCDKILESLDDIIF